MSLEAEIMVGLKLGDSEYKIDLNIPSSEPSAEAPYKFNVAAVSKSDPEKLDAPLLVVAAGGGESEKGKNDGNFYVAVSPPKEIIDMAGGVVTNLEVVVNEGGYVPSEGKFMEKTSGGKEPSGDEE